MNKYIAISHLGPGQDKTIYGIGDTAAAAVADALTWGDAGSLAVNFAALEASEELVSLVERTAGDGIDWVIENGRLFDHPSAFAVLRA